MTTSVKLSSCNRDDLRPAVRDRTLLARIARTAGKPAPTTTPAAIFGARMRLRLLAVAMMSAALALPAGAMGADTPRQKTLYRDGPSGRYLLDGVWYSRGDPGDQGQKLAWQKQSSTAGWTRASVPSAANAGDFSVASYLGTVHWYRKDFKAPSRALAHKWALRFESVNYRAKVWLNGRPLGFHVGAYLPFE